MEKNNFNKDGSANGKSFQWIIVDEVKLLEESQISFGTEKYDHLLQALSERPNHLVTQLSASTQRQIYSVPPWFGALKWIDKIEKVSNVKRALRS